MKAFAITEDTENTGGIYFADHAISAKRRFADEFNGGELVGIICRRVPWADEFADAHVPASLMVENGWSFECSGCGMRIDVDSLYDEGKLPGAVIGTQFSRVFCCGTCESRYRQDKAARRAVEEEAISQLREIVRRRFPSVQFVEERGEHAYAPMIDGRPKIDSAHVSFTFLGMKIGPAVLRLEDASRRWLAIPQFECCYGDKEAFEKFASETQAERT